jgi:hypothetical protein
MNVIYPLFATDFVDRYVLSIVFCLYSFFFIFYFRSNKNIPSPDQNQLSSMPVKMETNENTSSSASPTHQLNDELNSLHGKRKFSITQYREHKRLKSNDIVQNSSADIDMRVNTTENIKVRIKKEKIKVWNF